MPNPTHLEVKAANGSAYVADGQLLAIVRRSASFAYVRAFSGRILKVSLKTGLGIGVGPYRIVSNRALFNV